MTRALITGASRGIGAAVARRLVVDGWQVVDLSRSSGHDVTKPATLSTQLVLCPQAVVCCAGDVDPTPIGKTTADAWEHSLRVNVTHQWHVLHWAATAGVPPKAVVLVGSTAGTRPSPGWSAYSAAKAALHNLGVTAAVELAPRGTRVYVVAPGRCATDLRAKLAPDEDPATIMQPSEVADVVATCIADTAGVLAGQIIEVARR